MKKIVLLMLMLSLNVFPDSIETFLDYNVKSDFTMKNGVSLEKDSKDLSLTMEFYSPPKGRLQGGFGFIQNRVEIKNYADNIFNMTSYYLVEKYYLTKGRLETFAKIQGGGYYPSTVFGKTNINNPSEVIFKNGWYYGVALGIQYKNFILQTAYKGYFGDSQINGIGTKFDYNTTTISLGYNLGV